VRLDWEPYAEPSARVATPLSVYAHLPQEVPGTVAHHPRDDELPESDPEPEAQQRGEDNTFKAELEYPRNPGMQSVPCAPPPLSARPVTLCAPARHASSNIRWQS
jgi:hypothetical protein